MTRWLLLCLATLPLRASADELRVVFPENDPMGGWVESRQLTQRELDDIRSLAESDFAKTLMLWVDAEDELPPMAGSLQVEGRRLVFRPKFPWRSGLHYRARLVVPGGRAIEERFRAPKAKVSPRTRVERIYPDSDSVPANLLRFYVEFSGPMDEEQSLDGIRLLDAEGSEIHDAFVETVALWDRERRRLTLICHPGRIKRGLQLHDRMGAPLAEGGRVTLEVSRGMTDARGQNLVEDGRREFAVVEADRSAPAPERWQWSPPSAGTRDPLRIHFGEQLDAFLVGRMLSLRGPDGEVVAGAAEVRPDGSGWNFVPSGDWKAGHHGLRIDARLEDLSGNRVNAPFEQHPGEEGAPAPPFVELCILGCS